MIFFKKISLFFLTVGVLCIGCNLFTSNVPLLVYWLGYSFVDQWILIIMTWYCMPSHLFPNLKKKKNVHICFYDISLCLHDVNKIISTKQSQFYSILRTVYLDN